MILHTFTFVYRCPITSSHGTCPYGPYTLDALHTKLKSLQYFHYQTGSQDTILNMLLLLYTRWPVCVNFVLFDAGGMHRLSYVCVI